MPKIYPIKELRNTNEISEICHESQEPIYITKNGYGDLVVMSIEAYEKVLAKLELYEKLAEGESQLRERELMIPAKEAFSRIRSKYGEK
jgi:prevent-host-death family protein